MQTRGSSLPGIVVAVLALLLYLPAALYGQAGVRPRARWIEGDILVRLRGDLPAAALANLRASAETSASGDEDQMVARVGAFHIRRFRSRLKNTQMLLDRLRGNPNVLYAEPNYI